MASQSRHIAEPISRPATAVYAYASDAAVAADLARLRHVLEQRA